MTYKRLSPTTVEIDGENYVKDYSINFNYNELGSIYEKIKSIDDAVVHNKISRSKHEMQHQSTYRFDQLQAFNQLSELADALNEGKTHDENGFRYYVYYDRGELFICEHTYSVRHVIYFASRKIAQYSINIARKQWKTFYNIPN